MRVGTAMPSEGLGFSAGMGQGLGESGACARQLCPFLQTQGSAAASSTCSTQTASGSAVGPSTWYRPLPSPPQLLCFLSSLWGGGRGAVDSPGEGGQRLTWAFFHFSPSLSPRFSVSLQDRMVLLVMGNIINWSL